MQYALPTRKAYISRETLNSLKLADEALYYCSVDLILGNRYYETCQLNSTLTFDEMVFRSSQFGWTPTGPIPTSVLCNNISFSFISTREIQSDLKRFFEIEDVGVTIETSLYEQKMCEQHILETYSRSDDGRFLIRLPFKESPKLLGELRTHALQSLVY